MHFCTVPRLPVQLGWQGEKDRDTKIHPHQSDKRYQHCTDTKCGVLETCQYILKLLLLILILAKPLKLNNTGVNLFIRLTTSICLYNVSLR